MYKIKITVFVLITVLVSTLKAQVKEEITIPLSNPENDGKLHVSLLQGSIKVYGYDGKDVIITASSRDKSNSGNSSTKNGMKKISSNSIGFTAEELNNLVVIKSKWSNTATDFEIKVPRNFSLQLFTVNDGEIYAENLNGEFEVTNTNGGITLMNVSGSVVADALNEDIIVEFNQITVNVPMAFTSLNGDIDVTFPKSLKADILARTDNGDVFTDFEMTVSKTKPKVSKRGESGVYKVTSEKGVSGSINGGGATMTFKTLNGDIMIREKR